jgi:hypothetical protein
MSPAHTNHWPCRPLIARTQLINTALAAPPAVDPCKLLTHAEIEQVIGKLKGGPVGESIGNAVTYTYEFADGKGAFEI